MNNPLHRANRIKKDSPYLLIATFFTSFAYTGYSPVAPGTVGSIAAFVPLYFLSYFDALTVLFCAFTVFIVGTYATHLVTLNNKDHDPSWIVIDEVAGVILLYPLNIYLLGSVNFSIMLISFILFRAFDITKWGPVGYIENHLRNCWGVMLDDIVASVFASITTALLNSAITSIYNL